MNDAYQRQTFQLENEHWWYRARRKIILTQFQRCFRDRNDLRILDIGCGAGTLLKDLSRFGQVLGLDASPAAVEAAQERGGNVCLGSVPDNVPANLGRFDVVCLFDVIEHLDDDTAALQGAYSLLNDGGMIFVTVPALPWLYGIHDEINHHRRRYTRPKLYTPLATANFTEMRISYFNMLLSPLLIPAILWRSHRRCGHNFEVRSRLAPLLERVLGFERLLIGSVSLPFGLSLIATAKKGIAAA